MAPERVPRVEGVVFTHGPKGSLMRMFSPGRKGRLSIIFSHGMPPKASREPPAEAPRRLPGDSREASGGLPGASGRPCGAGPIPGGLGERRKGHLRKSRGSRGIVTCQVHFDLAGSIKVAVCFFAWSKVSKTHTKVTIRRCGGRARGVFFLIFRTEFGRN